MAKFQANSISKQYSVMAFKLPLSDLISNFFLNSELLSWSTASSVCSLSCQKPESDRADSLGLLKEEKFHIVSMTWSFLLVPNWIGC